MTRDASMRCGAIIVTLLAVSLLVIGLFLSLKKTGLIIPKTDQNIYYTDESISSVFVVSESFDVPISSYKNLWTRTIVSFLESSYRFFGVQTGYLSANEYVEYSPSAIDYHINNIISSAPSYQYLDQGIALTLHHLIKCNLSSSKHISIPYGMCNDDECSNYPQIIAKNPVSFQVFDYKMVKTVRDMKYLLLETERPLLITFLEPLIEFALPCTDKRVDQKNECTLLFPALLPSNEYFLPANHSKLRAMKPVTYMVVGWNDDHVNIIGKERQPYIKESHGGFIIKKADHSSGNLINYYMGSKSSDYNRELCHDLSSPSEWIGVRIDGTVGNYTKLECINSEFCNTSYEYALAVKDNNERIVGIDEHGLSITKMYIIHNSTYRELINFDRAPFHCLSYIFRANLSRKNPLESCLYGFLPFDLLEEEIRISSSSKSMVHAISIGIKWPKESYPSYSKESQGLIASIRHYKSKNYR